MDQYLEKLKNTQNLLIDYIKTEDCENQNLDSLMNSLKEENILEKKHEMKEFLSLISVISNNHCRTNNFIAKFESLFQLLKELIMENFESHEIFNIFKRNKRIILLLIEQQIITIDKLIVDIMMNKKYEKYQYNFYFYPEIKEFLNYEQIKIVESEKEKMIDFEIKRRNGENESKICQIIRNDSLNEFIEYTNSFESIAIQKSIYETNPLLIKNDVSIPQYVVFNGAVEILKYLIKNKNFALTPSLFQYAIHSDNAEIIHLLEEEIKFDKESLFNIAVQFQNAEIIHIICENIIFDVESLSKYADRTNNAEIIIMLEDETIFDEESLLMYAIKSKNADIIQLIDDKIMDNTKNKKCLFEAFKCHHLDLANYFCDFVADNFGVDNSAINDSTLEDSVVDNSVVNDSTLNDSVIDDFDVGNSTSDDFDVSNSTSDDFDVDDTSIDNYVGNDSTFGNFDGDNLSIDSSVDDDSTLDNSVLVKSLQYHNYNFFPSTKSFCDRTVFYNLCKYDYIEIIKLLYDKEDINISYKNNEQTPLQIAANKGNYDTIYFLIEKKGIFSEAFVCCYNLTHITIPKTVKEIGKCSFDSCFSLKKVSFSSQSSLKIINYRAFAECESLESIEIPFSVEYIGSSAFFGCSKLEYIEIPSSVKYIGGSAFNGCLKLEYIEIPSSVTHIGHSAFNGCESLSSIEIPSSVKKISQSLFEQCTSLNEIILPDSIEVIKAFAFRNCKELSEITIPSSVVFLGIDAFEGCENLTRIIKLTPKEFGENRFPQGVEIDYS